jgi:hypothetical protein
MELHFIHAPHAALMNGQYDQIAAGRGTLAQVLAAGFSVAGIMLAPASSDTIMLALQRPRPAAPDNVF